MLERSGGKLTRWFCFEGRQNASPQGCAEGAPRGPAAAPGGRATDFQRALFKEARSLREEAFGLGGSEGIFERRENRYSLRPNFEQVCVEEASCLKSLHMQRGRGQYVSFQGRGSAGPGPGSSFGSLDCASIVGGLRPRSPQTSKPSHSGARRRQAKRKGQRLEPSLQNPTQTPAHCFLICAVKLRGFVQDLSESLSVSASWYVTFSRSCPSCLGFVVAWFWTLELRAAFLRYVDILWLCSARVGWFAKLPSKRKRRK